MGLPGVLERTKPKNNQMEQQQFSFIFFFLSSFSSLFSDSRMRTSGEVIPGCSIPLVFYHLFLLDSAFVGSRLQYAEVMLGKEQERGKKCVPRWLTSLGLFWVEI